MKASYECSMGQRVVAFGFGFSGVVLAIASAQVVPRGAEGWYYAIISSRRSVRALWGSLLTLFLMEKKLAEAPVRNLSLKV